MAPSPTSPRMPFSPIAFVADVVSYGYAVLVVAATLVLDLQFTIVEGVAITVLFVLLRAVAREIRAEQRRQHLRLARRHAQLVTASPSRWNQEQRDGLGRRVDLGA